MIEDHEHWRAEKLKAVKAKRDAIKRAEQEKEERRLQLHEEKRKRRQHKMLQEALRRRERLQTLKQSKRLGEIIASGHTWETQASIKEMRESTRDVALRAHEKERF